MYRWLCQIPKTHTKSKHHRAAVYLSATEQPHQPGLSLPSSSPTTVLWAAHPGNSTPLRWFTDAFFFFSPRAVLCMNPKYCSIKSVCKGRTVPGSISRTWQRHDSRRKEPVSAWARALCLDARSLCNTLLTAAALPAWGQQPLWALGVAGSEYKEYKSVIERYPYSQSQQFWCIYLDGAGTPGSGVHP